MERRLAAILAADVAGYSRLMGANEEGTLAQLKSVRKALVDPTIAAHRGRIVKTTGDGVLVEFASAVDAVRNAVEIQRSMAEQNTAVPQDQRIEFRMGIHVGDIIFDGNDIFGTASTLLPGSKPWLNRVASASRRQRTSMSERQCPSPLRTSVRKG